MLEFIAFIFIYLGICGMVLTALHLMALQYESSLGWGMACTLFSPVQLVWLIMHWRAGRTTFFYQLLSILIAATGAITLFLLEEHGYLPT